MLAVPLLLSCRSFPSTELSGEVGIPSRDSHFHSSRASSSKWTWGSPGWTHTTLLLRGQPSKRLEGTESASYRVAGCTRPWLHCSESLKSGGCLLQQLEVSWLSDHTCPVLLGLEMGMKPVRISETMRWMIQGT